MAEQNYSEIEQDDRNTQVISENENNDDDTDTTEQEETPPTGMPSVE